jgi:hypothetical protein
VDLKVTLSKHIAKQKTQIGDKIVELDVDMKQCFVHANGQFIAIYCGQQSEPNKYLSFIQPMPKAVQEAIAAEVTKLTGGVGAFNAPPPDEHEVISNDDE